MNGDPTLTEEDYHHLYYGFVYQDDYRPLDSPPTARNELFSILEKGPLLGTEELMLIINLGHEVMKREPFNLSNINFLTFAFGELGDTLNERLNYNRFNRIIETIKWSGTGLAEDSPWHVINFDNANDIMTVMELDVDRSMIISRTEVYMALRVPRDGIRGYYFDYSRIYSRPPTETQQRQGMGINLNGTRLNRR